MAFHDFQFPDVLEQLGLSSTEGPLFDGVAPLEPPDGFLDRLREDNNLASTICTEKARAEFITAPILLALRRMTGARFGVFSGVRLDVDSARGLDGECDFLMTRSSFQTFVAEPILVVAEGTRSLTRPGWGKCIAGMVAALAHRSHARDARTVISGVATTGTHWQFMQLDNGQVTLDLHEYTFLELRGYPGSRSGHKMLY